MIRVCSAYQDLKICLIKNHVSQIEFITWNNLQEALLTLTFFNVCEKPPHEEKLQEKFFSKVLKKTLFFFAENLRQRPQKLEYECNIFFKILSLLHIQSTVPQLSIFTSTFKCTLACVYGRWFSLCKTIPQYSLHPPLSTSQRSTTTQVLCCLQNCLKLNTWWIY